MRMPIVILLVGLALAAASPSDSTAGSLAAGMEALERHDWPAAMRELRPLADAGEVHAQLLLGATYFNGWGVAVDDTEAARFYRMAADRGYQPAQGILASLYANGRGVPQDFAEAARLYRLAADQGGDWSSNVALAQLYANGQGVPQDDVMAVRWYRPAAEAGRADAQSGLGRMYYNGTGVPQDFQAAASWFRKAADQGNADGQTNLGVAYGSGKGVPKDLVQAYKWLTLALGRYSPKRVDERALATHDRDVVARAMTEGEIAEATRQAAAWKPKEHADPRIGPNVLPARR
jgi:TPR repeat protein